VPHGTVGAQECGHAKERRVTGSDHETSAESTSIFSSGLVAGSEEAATEPPLTGLEALPVGQALLVVKRGPNAGSRFQLDKDLVSAGRHPESDIFLDDISVSRRHAEFRKVGGHFEVSDVGSLNGTWVNREPIEQPATLGNGDEVQIGKFRLVFLTGGRDEGAAGS